ncbi:hypothetical protein F4678DRAFT_287125 [Xylaria arbuscula]|nr:hypothetical protein F4678DRAFT_287125 [Xylaria arbuscula]
MKSNTLILSSLASLAGASPVQPRQLLDFALLDSAPAPSVHSVAFDEPPSTVTYNLPAATQAAIATPLPVEAANKRSLDARDNACSPQPLGSGLTPSPDTASEFLTSVDFSVEAQGAVTPNGYYRTFFDLKASNSAYGYSGYSTLESYDTAECARRCDNINSCLGFNIYFERDPVVNPGPGCTKPDSTTNIKCVYWGGYISTANANNAGQWREDFEVVIAGSNGYMKSNLAPISGYTGVSLGNYAINAPLNCLGQDTFMGSKIFTTSYYDVGLCAAACQSQNEYNTAHPPSTGSPKICKFFVTYLSERNGSPEGQICSLYTQPWDTSYATNDGQWRGTDHYTNDYAFAYTDTTYVNDITCPGSVTTSPPTTIPTSAPATYSASVRAAF